MTELLFRKIELPTIHNLKGRKVQISYNDSNRLALRFFDRKDEDLIIVFDEETTWKIINFIRNIGKG